MKVRRDSKSENASLKADMLLSMGYMQPPMERRVFSSIFPDNHFLVIIRYHLLNCFKRQGCSC